MALARNPAQVRADKKQKTDYVYQTKTKTMTKDWTAHELGIDDEEMDGLVESTGGPNECCMTANGPGGPSFVTSQTSGIDGVRDPSFDHTASGSQLECAPFGHQCVIIIRSRFVPFFCLSLQRETLISSPHRRDDP